jgi:hypothetical protein
MTREAIAIVLAFNFFAIAMACAFAAEGYPGGQGWVALALGFLLGGVVLSWLIATAIVGKP